MKIFTSLIIAFSMYSKIPMPMVEWDEKGMQWVFGWFPMVGAVIGGLLLLWAKIAAWLSLPQMLFGGIAMLIPFAVTGGIHMDGLCDTCDALGSHQSRERKLEIMKDSHIGAFGVMGCVIYLFLSYSCWCSVSADSKAMFSIALMPVLSRSWVSVAALTRKNARRSGLLATFSNAAAGRWNLAAALVWMAVSGALMCLLSPSGVWMAASSAVVALWYYRMTEKEFGGITGDLAGYYLQMLELGMMLAAALTGGL